VNHPERPRRLLVLALVEGALDAGHDAELKGQLLWLQNELEKQREKLGG